MRDILLGLLLVYGVVRSLRQAWFGVLAWAVVSLMNPHRLTYRLEDLPVAAAIGLAALIGVVASRDRKVFPWTRESVTLILLMMWFGITTLASPRPEDNWDLYKKVLKIDFMVLVTMTVLYSRRHLMALAWTLVVSLGFYGVKGGVFTILTGGSFRVWGPPGTYIEGNNELALALVMVIPLMRFLQLNSSSKWVRRGLTAAMLLSAAAALGSHSRGALLAIGAMVGVLWWRGQKKLQTGLALVLLSVGLVAFMPDNWTQRMNTIGTYDEDASAMGRINAWWMAFNLAKDKFFGGGFQIYDYEHFLRYAPVPEDVHAAHSIYFQILGEHGFVGLLLFLVLWLFTWGTAGKLRRLDRDSENTRWLSDLGAMCQVSLAGFAVGGTFLSLAYFDMTYYVMVLVVLGSKWHERKAWMQESGPAAPNPPPGTPKPLASPSPLPR